MSVVKATLIFSIATYLDVILNPLMGFITDSFYRTKLGRKFGRRRFFILTGIPLMLLYPMLWVKNMNFFYYLTTYILFEFVYTRPHLARAERTSYCVYPGNSCHISSRHVVSIPAGVSCSKYPISR